MRRIGGRWLSLLNWLSFWQVTVIRTPPDFFGITARGVEYGEALCWIKPAPRNWFKAASTSLAMMGLMPWGKNARIFTQNIFQLFDGVRGPARAVKVKRHRSQG